MPKDTEPWSRRELLRLGLLRRRVDETAPTPADNLLRLPGAVQAELFSELCAYRYPASAITALARVAA